jgi:hypothetical protein
MAAPSTYTPEQKAAMAELTLDEGMTIRQAQATLAAGYRDIPLCKPSLQTIADEKNKAQLARTPEIPADEPTALVDGLARRSLALIGKQLALIEKKPDTFDADDMLKIVRTLVEAKSLAQPARNKGKDKPASLLQGLHSVPGHTEDPNAAVPASTPVSVHVAS